MKKLLLLSGLAVAGLTVAAEEAAQPISIENFVIYAISSNARYAVSEGTSGMRIADLSSGKTYDYMTEDDGYMSISYSPGMGKCVSDTGIVVGTCNGTALYWINESWRPLAVPSYAVLTNLANAVTPDGSRICGSLGVSAMSYDEDTLMQAPCLWTWNEQTGDYDLPVLLPHPDYDYSGRVPQYITAIDISDDGKTIVGQIVNAMGMFRYAIIYKENENGEWSYFIPDEKGLCPEGLEFPKYPGDAPILPTQESFMTQEEIDAYLQAMNDYYNSEEPVAYPAYEDFMTPEEQEAYEKAYAAYAEEYAVWEAKFVDWSIMNTEIASKNPNYVFNSIRVSPDGKTFAGAVNVEGESEGDSWWGVPTFTNIWVRDIETDAVTKYDQQDNFVLTCLCNNGVAFASIDLREEPQSFILSEGEAIGMKTWMGSKEPRYESWIGENMTFEIETFVENPDTGEYDIVYQDMQLTGRAYATADLSFVALGVPTIWDDFSDGLSGFFDMKNADGVSAVTTATSGKTVFDLSGRRLKNADAPGIYIINGEKKVVR